MTNAHVLAIDFGGTKIAIATAVVGATDGSPHRILRLPTLGEAGAGQALRRAFEAGRALVADPAVIGVSTFGVLNEGRVCLAPNVREWEGLLLPELLHDEFGDVPVRIANDVKAGTAAELRWGALRGVDVGLYVNLGTGLAVGLVIGGQVISGSHGAAGEIGYLREKSTDGHFVDGHAALEESVSGAALSRRGSNLLNRGVTTAEVFSLHAEPKIVGLLDEAVEVLARTIANLCVTVDPERVVLGGGMMGAQSHIVPRVAEELRRSVPFPPELRAAQFIDDAPLLGALALALDAAG